MTPDNDEAVSEFRELQKRPEIIDLYNAVSKLIIEAFLLPRRHTGDAVAVSRCQLKQIEIYEAAEDLMARGLIKQRVPEVVARQGAMMYVGSMVDALSRSPLDAIGKRPPDQDGITWVRID